MAERVITLVQYPTALGMPNLSPFCMKVETWLRLAGLPYTIEWLANPRKAPLGKLPLIKDGDTLVCDSHSIIEHLARAHGKDLDAGLSPQQQAVAHAFERMINEHLYWAIVHYRWADESGWNVVRRIFFGGLPPGVRQLVEKIARRGTRAQLDGHGLGRHPPAEILRRAGQDIDALAAQLGDKEYFMGSQPARLDASAYAFLASAWEIQLDTPLKPLVGRHPNLVAYCARMRARCFSESK